MLRERVERLKTSSFLLPIGWSKVRKEICHDTQFGSLEGAVAAVLR